MYGRAHVAVNLSGIGLSGTAVGTARDVPESQAPSTHEGSQDAAAARPGEVSITSTAALLAHLEQALGKQPPVDPNRVEALSRAIAEGRYQLDAGKTASGLLQSERSLAQLPMAEI
jgi:flagellar biosynthesis anti-sigma factor FlgM